MDQDQKRAFFAVVLSGLILFGWQYFFGQSSNVSYNTNIPVVENDIAVKDNGVDSLTMQGVSAVQIEKSSFIISNNTASYELDNFLNILDIKHNSSVFDYADIVGNDSALSIKFLINSAFESLVFQIEKLKDDHVVLFNEANNLKLDLVLNENGLLKFTIINKSLPKIRFDFKSTGKKLDNGQDRVFAYLDDSLSSIDIGDDKSVDKQLRWFGIDFNYHLFAIHQENKIQSLAKSTSDNKFLITQSLIDNDSFTLLFVKKEFDLLKSLGKGLHLAVDFGIWSILAEFILYALQWFYNFIPNYGVSIIFLTLIIRLLTFPLQYKSFKSMKKMQLIQPELTKLREKFKDDPQRMQRESMELFKRAGANPLGGCLPLLLQMPIFFAFYKVLYSAVELVNAPFFFWIKDLSNKDPYYVLPLLMTSAMFLQQKLTPTTVADPTQKKIMMFMPIVFGLIMKDLPSGLSLYIFVSTIFGVAQQMYVYKKVD
jgi:YidC/Oxa1 family membrane protein insertase